MFCPIRQKQKLQQQLKYSSLNLVRQGQQETIISVFCSFWDFRFTIFAPLNPRTRIRIAIIFNRCLDKLRINNEGKNNNKKKHKTSNKFINCTTTISKYQYFFFWTTGTFMAKVCVQLSS